MQPGPSPHVGWTLRAAGADTCCRPPWSLFAPILSMRHPWVLSAHLSPRHPLLFQAAVLSPPHTYTLSS